MMRRAALVVIAALAIGLGVSRDLSAAEVPKHRGLDPRFIRTQIKDILSAPEYNRGFDRQPALWTVIANSAARALDRLLRWLGGALSFGGGVGKNLSAVLAWIVIAVFVGMFAASAFRLSARFRARHETAAPEGFCGHELPSASRLMAEGARLAEAGDYRAAFLRAYLGSISYLDEVNALRFERSRTNWEYVRELGDRGLESIAEGLRPLTIDFDRKFYGREHCAREDYDRAVEAYAQVRRLAA